MPSWKVRSKSSERAKSWITSARQDRTGFTSFIIIPATTPIPARDEWPIPRASTATAVPSGSGGARRKQGVGRGPPGPLAVDLRLHTRDLSAQHVHPFLEFGHRVE